MDYSGVTGKIYPTKELAGGGHFVFGSGSFWRCCGIRKESKGKSFNAEGAVYAEDAVKSEGKSF